jgi:type II secretory pathway pseudopilin PulG
MKRTVKCSQCGFVGWADAENCKKCGASLTEPASSGPSSDAPYQPPTDYRYQTNDRGGFNGEVKKGLAICALVIGIINLFTLGVLGVGALVGIILSIVALTRIKRDPSRYGGKGLATAGLITSILSVFIIVPVGIIAAIAIPNIIASYRAANEGSAMQAMREISVAESTYQSTHAAYGTFDQLVAGHLIKGDLATGTRHGYKFTVEMSTSAYPSQQGFHAVAMPVQYPSSGRRSFFIDENGVIRAVDAQGAAATEFDPPLGFKDSSQPSSGDDTSERY